MGLDDAQQEAFGANMEALVEAMHDGEEDDVMDDQEDGEESE